jgi:hypothetical protein
VHADPILPIISFIIYVYKCIVHLSVGFEWKYSCIKVYPSALSLLFLL